MTRGRCTAAALFLSLSTLHGSQISSFDRGNSQSMLKAIKEDLTKYYYDPKFRGMDVEKTFAEPPERLTRVDYGWTAKMIGDAPYVSWVKKDSDAQKKGLAVGDRILTWNRFEPSRANLWQINYVYR